MKTRKEAFSALENVFPYRPTAIFKDDKANYHEYYYQCFTCAEIN